MTRFCRYCGEPLRENTKFCRNCGKAVPVKSQPAGSQPLQPEASVQPVQYSEPAQFATQTEQFAAQSPAKQKKEKAPKPPKEPRKPINKKKLLIASTAIVLVIAIAATAISYPHYIRPMLDEKKAQSFVVGNSKAFSVQPAEGVTISAPENALDKNRKFKMEEVPIERSIELEESLTDMFEDEDFAVYKTWELDAGLEDNEILPGTFDIEVDLEELGIDESQYENVVLVRTDDSGVSYEYCTELDGHTLKAKSDQNCLLTTVILYTGITLAGMAVYDTTLLSGTKAYYRPTLRKGISKFDVQVDGEDRFKIIADMPKVRKLLQDLEKEETRINEKMENAAIKNALTEAIKESSLSEENKATLLKNIPADLQYYKIDTKLRNQIFGDAIWTKDMKKGMEVRNAMHSKFTRFLKAEKEKDKEYAAFLEKVENLKHDKEDLEEVKKEFTQIDRICDYLVKAYKYLRDDRNLKVPTDVTQVHLSYESTGSSGTSAKPTVGNSYMVLYLPQFKSGSETAYDDLFLTITHELFHSVQREYVSKPMSNVGFDEMSAMALEWDAFLDYSGKTDPDTGKRYITSGKDKLLKNLNATECFAIPLDDYSYDYPEGHIGVENLWKARTDRPDVSYPRAPFFRYLMKTKDAESAGEYTYAKIMERYKGTSGHSYMTTLLKACFNCNDAQMTDYFKDFAMEDLEKFKDAAEGGDKVFAPIANVKSSKADIQVPNNDYTIRMRRVKIDHKNPYDESYAIVLYENDDFKRTLSDLEFIPIDLTEEEDYVQWNNGLFFKEKEFPDNTEEPVMTIMEVDGGTTPINSTLFTYSIVILLQPEVKSSFEGTTLTIQPMKLPQYKEDIISGIVVSAYAGKERVMFEQIGYKNWTKPWEIDLSEIEIDGEPLTDEQMASLKIEVQECVAGTFNEDGEDTLLGPATLIDSESTDITGTWNVISTTDYSSKVLDSAVDAITDLVGESGKEAQANYYAKQKGNVSKSKMIVRKTEKGSQYPYEACFEYLDSGAPNMGYDGTYDPKTRKLTLKPKLKSITDKNGKTYNLADYGLEADIVLTIVNQRDKKTGETKTTCVGESKVNSMLLKYDSAIKGVKVSNKTDGFKIDNVQISD
ncbi:MAG: zinc ribbon domain-containing protein [Lachnospiraceae bacterium]|nr:zinc ribbon domain-containing protein [Lachnospiraceae bacterium]